MASVSVIIPAYNAARYVRETIDSVLNQTHADTEIIVVDDGSTDDTPKILESYGGRIRLLRQTNQGLARTRNIAASQARGEWLAFLDADDVWMPNKLERQLDQCGGYAISHTGAVLFGEHIADTLRSGPMSEYSGWVCRRLLLGNFITASTVMVRKDAFTAHGGFDESYHTVEDWPFWLNFCAHHELGYVPEPLIRYRVHSHSMTMNSRLTSESRVRVLREAFAPGGVGHGWPELRRAALASAHLISVHYAAQSGDARFAVWSAIQTVRYQPARPVHWKWLLKALTVAAGCKY